MRRADCPALCAACLMNQTLGTATLSEVQYSLPHLEHLQYLRQ